MADRSATLSAALTAAADPSRRRMVQRLAHGPATTGQLAELFPISRPAVSQHLKVLQGAGLVHTTTVGRHRWHELATGPLALIAAWATDLTIRAAAAPTLRVDAGRNRAREGAR